MCVSVCAVGSCRFECVCVCARVCACVCARACVQGSREVHLCASVFSQEFVNEKDTCRAAITRSVTHRPNQVSKDTLRANDNGPSGIFFHRSGNWDTSEKEWTYLLHLHLLLLAQGSARCGCDQCTLSEP